MFFNTPHINDVCREQVKEIVYAKYGSDGYYYLAEVQSVMKKNKVYDLLYMDGDRERHVPEKKITKVPARERNDKMIGKTFFEPGDGDIKKGEFKVLCRQPGGRSPTYWCERVTNCCGDEREIVEMVSSYVRDTGRVVEYDNE